MHRAHAEELRTTLFMPPHKLPSQPGLQLHDSSGSILFSDLPATHRNVESCGREVHASLAKYMKLTRRCSPKEHDDAVIELSQHRRMFQKAAVIYHARLNAAHFEREMVPLNAFFGFLTTLRNHSKKINEVAEQTSLTDFSEVIKSQFDCRQVQSTQATEEFLNTLTNIQSLPLALFAPEPLFAKTDKSYLRSPDTSLFSKSGYLYMRVKKTFGFDWNEVYCFTQGGNLLCQQKGDLGAGVLVNLNGKGVFAEPVDIDDRRYTFQIVSAAEKRSVILQAENSTDRDEWIQTISNVILNTSSWARTGQPPPDLKFKKEPQPFVLVPKLQFMGSPEPEDADEEGSLQQALRASLSCSDWIAQSPPYHSELIATGAQSAPSKVEFEVPVTFIGCMPLPEFLG
uniref:PH domain-containing protein n=1 Tax=Mesocestoides corti TaxID=53468 RepID=A0A5K3FKZ4_MESCO